MSPIPRFARFSRLARFASLVLLLLAAKITLGEEQTPEELSRVTNRQEFIDWLEGEIE